MLKVSALFIYPIKACRGIEVQAFRLDALGPQLDRRFMLVDEQGGFISQRQEPRLSQVVPTLGPTALLVKAPGMQTLKLPLSLRDDGRVTEIKVWKHTGPAIEADASVHEWFSEWLHRPCRLVHMPYAQLRRVDPDYAAEPAFTAFTDGFPELLVSQSSVDDLGKRAQMPLSVERFRPNIVVSGSEPYAEDSWKHIRIGDVPFDVVKPCSRCAVTTIDPATSEQGKEPLATLASYRKQNGKTLFGQNCIHRELGTIRVSDPVEVLTCQREESES